MNILQNLDLLSVGFIVAATGVLGFTIYFNNRQSKTNQAFLLFSLVTVCWSLVNFFQYKTTIPSISLWLLRLVIFFAVWHAFTFFNLFYVFPEEQVVFSKTYKYLLFPIVILTSIINLTPLVFHKVTQVTSDGRITSVENGPAIIIFAFVVVELIISGLIILFRKTRKAQGLQKKQFRYVALGTFITFALLITFNFVFPAFLNNPGYIPLGALFIFPFIVFTSYSILRYKLFNIKIIGVASLTFVLSVVTFFEVIYSVSTAETIFRGSIFLLVLIIGISLLRGVFREVEQREKIEKLAGELKEANETQAQTMNFITHQIRRTFTDTKAGLSAVMEGDYDPVSEPLKLLIQEMFKAQQMGVKEIETFLKATRIESGTVQYDMKPFDLKAIVTEIAAQEKGRAEDKKLKYEVNIADDGQYTIQGDKVYLEQVISNLIDNSIRYTKEGYIQIKLFHNDNMIIFTVKDSGYGMTEEDKAKLFTKYGHGKDSRLVNVDSTGLGLFIVKGIVEAHHGHIRGESEGRGKGSTFSLELPINLTNQTITET